MAWMRRCGKVAMGGFVFALLTTALLLAGLVAAQSSHLPFSQSHWSAVAIPWPN